MDTENTEITLLLQQSYEGDSNAMPKLFDLVYTNLKAHAKICIHKNYYGKTITPTSLVHEFFLRLAGTEIPFFKDRGEFFGFARVLMRRIIVDQIRYTTAQKRGAPTLSLKEDFDFQDTQEQGFNLTALHEALEILEKKYPRAGQIVEFRFFMGFTLEKIAEIMALSISTVKRDWLFAKSWLYKNLQDSEK